MVYMHREKKKGHEFESLRIRPLLGRGKRIISVPCGVWTTVLVKTDYVGVENNEERFWVKKQPGLFDEGVIITGN